LNSVNGQGWVTFKKERLSLLKENAPMKVSVKQMRLLLAVLRSKVSGNTDFSQLFTRRSLVFS